MAALPTGTVTFLFTDIEGSTALLQQLGDRRYAEVQEEHRHLLRAAFRGGNGQEVDRLHGPLSRWIGSTLHRHWHRTSLHNKVVGLLGFVAQSEIEALDE
jgi:class 3 adenylate cyclase